MEVIVNGQKYVPDPGPLERLPWQEAYGGWLVLAVVIALVILVVAFLVWVDSQPISWRCVMFSHRVTQKTLQVPADEGGTREIIFCKRCLKKVDGSP